MDQQSSRDQLVMRCEVTTSESWELKRRNQSCIFRLVGASTLLMLTLLVTNPLFVHSGVTYHHHQCTDSKVWRWRESRQQQQQRETQTRLFQWSERKTLKDVSEQRKSRLIPHMAQRHTLPYQQYYISAV